MPEPELAVVAEGDLPTGHHWILKAGGSSTLLPQTAGLASVTATTADGTVLERQDLAMHEAAWQRFLRREDRPPGSAPWSS